MQFLMPHPYGSNSTTALSVQALTFVLNEPIPPVNNSATPTLLNNLRIGVALVDAVRPMAAAVAGLQLATSDYGARLLGRASGTATSKRRRTSS
jgi:hypothetical protein